MNIKSRRSIEKEGRDFYVLGSYIALPTFERDLKVFFLTGYFDKLK